MARDEINAFLGAGTTYEGKLSFHGSVRIDGAFIGEVDSDGALVVGREANISGRIRVGQLILSGRVEGEVVARERVVLHKTAVLHGTVHSPKLVMEEGAVLEGTLSMNSAAPAETVALETIEGAQG